MRMPAAQTLFLFAHTIDTDPEMTRFVFDSWLELVFTDSASARLLLVNAIELRNGWSQLLQSRLKQSKCITNTLILLSSTSLVSQLNYI